MHLSPDYNFGAQQKLSRYVPDDKGGYAMKWRTGRAALADIAQPGEIYGAIHVRSPVNGLVSVIERRLLVWRPLAAETRA